MKQHTGAQGARIARLGRLFFKPLAGPYPPIRVLLVLWGMALHFMPAAAQTPVTIQPPNLAGALAGSLPGSAGTSRSGAATYSIPLALPPGTAGMLPALSLDYSSLAGTGISGQGWNLGGMSSITRCAKTLVQDGVRRAVALTADDEFCIDGQRLLMVPGSGTHGATAEYRTQLESFSRIRSFGTHPAKGPDSWEVRSKGGLILTYGNTPDAVIEAQGKTTVLTWALSRTRDRRGNYYDIKYGEANTATLGEYRPERIVYTGNLASGMAPYNAVDFLYEDRPDLLLGFVAGSRLTGSKRLTAVRTRTLTAADGSGGTLVRDYRIAYTTNPASGRSVIHRISDCGGDGTCLPATQFTWTTRDPAANTLSAPGSGNWGGPAVVFQSANAKEQQIRTQVTMGDFDADGASDLARSDGSGNWQVCLSRGNRFDCQAWAGPAILTRDTMTGDWNGDGRTDIAVYPKIEGPAAWTMCLSSGSGFNCQAWAGRGAVNPFSSGEPTGHLVGDFNADGRDDVALAGPSGSEYLCKSTGSGFEGGDCHAYPGSWNFVYHAQIFSEESMQAFARNQMGGDLDGDGRTDYVHYIGMRTDPAVYPPGRWSGIRATDTGFVGFGASSNGQVLLDVEGNPGHSRFTDLNADGYGGLSDLVTGFIAAEGQPDKAEVCRSDGKQLMNCSLLPNVTNGTLPYHIGDMDGDGRADALTLTAVCQIGISAYGAGNTDTHSYTCTPWTPASLPAVPAASFIGDFNGDSRIDRASYIQTGTGSGYWSVHLSGHGGFADLLAEVADGLGQATQFDYKGLYDPAIYTPGAAVAYPKANAHPKGPAVAQMRVGNGQGGWLATDYQYEGHRVDLRGRGGLGFGKTRSIDRVKQITTQVTASQDFPYTGLATETRATQANGTVLSLQTQEPAELAGPAGARYPYVSRTQTSQRDLDNTAMATQVTRIEPGGIDAYGNVTHSIQTASAGEEVFSTDTVSTYDNQAEPWLIGQLRTTRTTRTATQSGTAPTPAQLVLNNCSSSSPSAAPTPATLSCALSNSGQGVAASIAYSGPAGSSVTGPSSCSGNAACGTVTVSSGTAPGTYAGTLTATPASGGSASVAVSLAVNGAVLSSSASTLAFGIVPRQTVSAARTLTVRNTGGAATTLTWPLSYTAGSAGIGLFQPAAAGTTCVSGGSLAAGASCVIAVTYTANCTGGTRSATLNLQGPGAAIVPVSLTATTNGGVACQ